MATFTYTAKAGMTINDNQTTHATLDVYGLGGLVSNVSIGIKGFTHHYPADVDMLLTGPNMSHNLAFMTDAGGSTDEDDTDFAFADGGIQIFPEIIDGMTYGPTDLGTDETGANWGLGNLSIHHPSLGATFASAFGGMDGNGFWALHIRDDGAGVAGSIDGWNLKVTTVGSTSTLNGGSSVDVINVLTTNVGNGTGTFQINQRGTVAFNGVYNFTINGMGGDDKIVTSGEMDSIIGGAGKDSIVAGGNADYISVFAGDDVAGETYDGGSGFDWLYKQSYQTLDLSDDTVKGIESLFFMTGGKLIVGAGALGGVTQVWGASDLTHPDVLQVKMGSAKYVDVGSINVINFVYAGDKVVIRGDGDAETILGSQVNDVIKAGGGKDLIVTNLGIDTVDGGDGRDTVSYLTRSVPIDVRLDGSHQVGVKVDGLVEDKIKNVENVIGGFGADKLVGDSQANMFKGNENADRLKGMGGNDKLEGGTGLDTLVGGSGKDKFVFATNLDTADHIKDFSHADDTIVLDNFVFAAFVNTGDIGSKMFHANATGHEAHTVKQHLIYDKADHSLWYDADGNGAGAAVEVAIFDNGIKNLDYHDFSIV